MLAKEEAVCLKMGSLGGIPPQSLSTAPSLTTSPSPCRPCLPPPQVSTLLLSCQLGSRHWLLRVPRTGLLGQPPNRALGPPRRLCPGLLSLTSLVQRGPSSPATLEWSEFPLFSVMSLPTSPLPSYTSLSHVRLCNSMDCTVHGILQARMLEWVALPFSRGTS